MNRTEWIYFLRLSKNLPSDYFAIDKAFKEHGRHLVPMDIVGLNECVDKDETMHVLIMIKKVSELRYYEKKVKKILKYMLKRPNVKVYFLSSFSAVNDPTLIKQGAFHFMRIPLSVNYFVGAVNKQIEIKEMKKNLWPGKLRHSNQL